MRWRKKVDNNRKVNLRRIGKKEGKRVYVINLEEEGDVPTHFERLWSMNMMGGGKMPKERDN